MKILSNYNGEFENNIEINPDMLENVGITVLIFVFGLLILLALFFIANRKSLNKKSKNYVNNSGVKNPNIVDVKYEFAETKIETPQYSGYATSSTSYQPPVQQKAKPKMSEQEFLTNLYRKKYNGEISEAEFDAALKKYRNSKDDFNE